MTTSDSPEVWAKWLGLETFGDPQLLNLAEYCAEWVRRFRVKSSPIWLTVIGTTETGKTTAINKLWEFAKGKSEWNRSDYIPGRVYWPRYIKLLKSGTGFGFRDDIEKWPVLFLDDVGADRDNSGFSADEFCYMLEARKGKWTLITSNLTMARIEEMDDRIANRMVRDGNLLCRIETTPYSLRQKS